LNNRPAAWSHTKRSLYLSLLLPSLTFQFLNTHAAAQTAVTQQSSFVNTLMPLPAELRIGGDSVIVTPQLTITLNGASAPLLQDAALRMLSRLEAQTGIQIDRDLHPHKAAVIDVSVQDASIDRPTLGVDESYMLDIGNGDIRLHAKTVFGALHGFETLLQLVQGQGSAWIIPPVHIKDAPRFPWRGLLLDPGRHFLPVNEVLRTLDAMAAVKMNVLHWHLTEDQGFRIESLRFPRLQELGSGGEYYTQQQVRLIVRYASARGIRIVPEFDVPGHSTTWLIGYPELASRPGPFRIEYENGIHDAALDPTRESTYRFLDTFFSEMSELFPDEYIHIGGDESNGKDWKANPEIVRFMQQHGMKDTGQLQAYFNSRVQIILKRHHKQMVGWDEILQPNLSQDVVVQNWHGTEFLINGARQGHRGLLSKPYYLDHMYSAAEMYSADPLPAGAGLSSSETALILGGEACMWGEQVTALTVDSRIWPRAAAVAERFWSPAAIRDPDDMYRRLAAISLRLDALGVTHISTPQKGLRQLAGSETGAQELSVLASVLQPVDFHERYAEQHTSALTPIGRLVDFTRPDPPSKHQFQILVDAYLRETEPAARQSYAQQLEETFHRWIATTPALDSLAQTHPLIAEISVRRQQLPQLGLLGLQVMGHLEAKSTPTAAWTATQENLLKQAAEHTELVDFVVLPPIEKLLKAASPK
jgi:hexosaminidase